MQLDEKDSLPPATLALSVVIVNYNVCDFLKQALASVERALGDLEGEVIVVDNNSADGSVDMVEADFPWVTVIRNEENIGFSRANNQALRISRGEFILVLNPDTIVSEDTLTVLVDFLRQNNDAGAAGCQILHPDGSFARESRRAFPTPMVAFFRISGLSRLFPRSKLFGRYNMSYLPVDEVAEIDALSGSCMMVRRESLLSNGPRQNETTNGADDTPRLLDEEFFMYGEDLDWCYRIQQAGWKIMYTPDTKIIHYKGESTRKGELRYVKLFYGAMVRFSRKHFHGYGKLVVELLRLAILFKAFLSAVSRVVSFILPAVIDFSIVYLSVFIAGFLRASQIPNQLFLLTVAPAFALVTVAGIALWGGYARRQRNFRSAVAGLLLALLIISAASFFLPQIAFSRLIVLLSVPIAGLLLALTRLAMRYKDSSISSAALVGSEEDEKEFLRILRSNPNPHLDYVGMVPVAEYDQGREAGQVAPLGRLDQLRDIVRLRGIDTVVFASGVLPNYRIFAIIQELRDLPVTFKMLTDTYERTIGKASIEDLAAPRMVAIDKVLPAPRSRVEKRLFGRGVALAGIILYPIALIIDRGNIRRTNQRTMKFMRVLLKGLPLIGVDESDKHFTGAELPLSVGAFSIVDALDETVALEDRLSAYRFYLTNESAQLDWDIMMRSIRTGR